MFSESRSRWSSSCASRDSTPSRHVLAVCLRVFCRLVWRFSLRNDSFIGSRRLVTHVIFVGRLCDCNNKPHTRKNLMHWNPQIQPLSAATPDTRATVVTACVLCLTTSFALAINSLLRLSFFLCHCTIDKVLAIFQLQHEVVVRIIE